MTKFFFVKYNCPESANGSINVFSSVLLYLLKSIVLRRDEDKVKARKPKFLVPKEKQEKTAEESER